MGTALEARSYVRALLVALLVAACAAEEQPTPGYFVSYDLYATNVLFDRLHVTLTHELTHYQLPRAAPLTPQMLANGESAPADFELYDQIRSHDVVLEPSHYHRFETEHELWHWGGLLALGFYGPDLVGVGFAPLTLVNQGNRHWVATGSLELKPAAVELWGVERTDGGPTWGPCARVGGPVMRYVIREIDTDCDLFWDWEDCQPSVYCDRDNLSSPACGCP